MNKWITIVALTLLWVPMKWSCADVSVIPTSVNLSMRGGNDYPWNSTVYPRKSTFTITSVDSWALAKAGDLNTGCGGSCFKLRNAANGNEVSSGSGNMIVVIDFVGFGSESLDTGNFTGTVTVNPSSGDDVVVNISLDVEVREPYLTFVYPDGYPVGCTNSSSGYSHADTCDIPDEYPPDSDFEIPAASSSYVDPAFGYTVKRITGPGNNHSYSTRSAFSADSAYLMLSESDAAPDIWRISDATKIHNNEPGNINTSIWWHWADPEKYIYINGAQIIERTIGSGSVTLADYSGDPWNFGTISDGGTNDITADGWIGVGSASTACVINLNGLTTENQATKIFCVDFSGESLTNVDFPMTSTPDAVTGKRYMILIAQPKQVYYEMNEETGTLDKIGNFGEQPQRAYPNDDDGICESGETCFTVPHAWIMNDSRGAHIVQSFDDIYGNKTYLATIQINKGADMWRPVEEGGGLRFLYSNSAVAETDNHFGASMNGWILSSSYGNSGGLATKVIASATSAHPSRVETTAEHGWSNGQEIVIGSANNTCLNIVSTITVVNSTTFDVWSADCSAAGAYNANSGIAAVGTASTDSPNRQEVVVMNPLLNEIRRIAHHRSKVFADTSGADTNISSYGSAPKCSISRLADRVACMTDFGVPETTSEIVIETGILDEVASGSISGRATFTGGANLR